MTAYTPHSSVEAASSLRGTRPRRFDGRAKARRFGPSALGYPMFLLAVFALEWTALAISPWYRQDWALENVCVVLALFVFVSTARRLRFSNRAYTLLFVFLSLHEIGAHYTYSQVPYDDFFRQLTGQSLNALLGFGRNHYDRLIHFLFGFLLLPLANELFRARAPARGLWRFLLPVLFIESLSAFFELIEWLAAVVFGGELGQAYLGTQGDVWDAQWDMLLALLGASLAQSMRFVRAAVSQVAAGRQST